MNGSGGGRQAFFHSHDQSSHKPSTVLPGDEETTQRIVRDLVFESARRQRRLLLADTEDRNHLRRISEGTDPALLVAAGQRWRAFLLRSDRSNRLVPFHGFLV